MDSDHPSRSSSRPAVTWATASYPLLLVRLMPTVYHLRPLPADLSREVLTSLAWAAMDAVGRRLQMCLIFKPDEALYLYPNGKTVESETIPWGGFNLAWYPPELDFLPGQDLPDQA